MKLALDAMGSDDGATPLVEGAVRAAKRPGFADCRILLVGREHTLKRLLRYFNYAGERIEIVPAGETVAMGANPTESLQLEDSSIAVAARLVREGKADALVSAGNTGATLAHCMRSWRRLKGVSRPGIAALMPTPDKPCLLLDVGANVDCRPRHLVDFAMMGAVYAREVLKVERPKVGILSVGAEEGKGNSLTKEAAGLLRATHLNFIGNAEGKDVFEGEINVIVCDGFVGNVVLKSCESVAKMIMSGLKGAIRKNVFSFAGGLMLAPGMRSFKRRIDKSEHGGAPLLGLNGICIIGHGSSDAKAVMNALRAAREAVDHSINARIAEELKQLEKELASDSGATDAADQAEHAG